MGSLYVRGNKIWIRYKDETEAWVGAPTESRPGEEKRARRHLASVEAHVQAAIEGKTKADVQPGAPLISDRRITEDRRVLYAMKALAGLRHGEAATLTWRPYDDTMEPLGGLSLEQTKTQVPRRVPVHPTLARVLADWKDAGWERTYGRAPTTTDLVVPTRNMTGALGAGDAEATARRSQDARATRATRPRSPSHVHHARAGRRRATRSPRDDEPRTARRHRLRLHDLPVAGALRGDREAQDRAAI
jgi:integrase